MAGFALTLEAHVLREAVRNRDPLKHALAREELQGCFNTDDRLLGLSLL